MQHNINTIFISNEGEGIHLGRAQIFVRYQGCAIACLNCDSTQTWDFSLKYVYELDSLLEKIESLSNQPHGKIDWVSITGGDPLHPKNTPSVLELTKALKAKGYKINLEASGSRIFHEIFEAVDFISFDYKTPSTQVKSPVHLLVELVNKYPHKFQIKSVTSGEEDFLDAYRTYRHVLESVQPALRNFVWVLTPVYNPGEEFPQARFARLMQLNAEYGGPFRVIGQQHKWVYGPDKEDV